MTDPFELLSALDAPRPIPTELRGRLEDALLSADQTRQLNADLAARLTTRMTDRVAELLEGLDSPLPLPASVRASLDDELGRRRSRTAWLATAAAAAVLVVCAAAALVATRPAHRPGVVAGAQPSASASASASAPPPVGSGTAPGTSGVAGGTSGLLPPTASQAPAPAGAPAAGTTNGSAGVAAGPPSRPSLTSVSPDAGPLRGGTSVRLRGPGLRTVRGVTFGGAAATQLRINEDGSVTVRTPASSRPADVTVAAHLRDGSQVTRPRGFSYLAAPAVDSATPSSGPAGTWVTLDGSGLARAIVVRFGDVVADDVRIVSDRRVRARAPAHSPGPVDINVTTPGGTSNAVRFLYLP
jgi:hypothetical protein